MPRPTSLVVKKGSKTRSATSAGMPVPVSVTESRTWSPSARVLRVTVPPAAVAWAALTSRLTSTCSISPASQVTCRQRLEIGRAAGQREIRARDGVQVCWGVRGRVGPLAHRADDRRDAVDALGGAGEGGGDPLAQVVEVRRLLGGAGRRSRLDRVVEA